MGKRRRNEKDFGEECLKCGSVFATTRALKTHIRYCKLRTSTSTTCEQCGKKFITMGYLKRHMKCHSGFYRVKCDLCTKTLSTKSDLRRHMRAVHADNQPIPTYPFACDICNKTFRKKMFLTNHKRIHTRKKIICKICSKPLANRNSVRSHNIRFHLDEYFNSKERHKIAMENQKKKTEENAIKNQCIMCSKKFKDQSQMFQHLLSHTDERPYICKICQDEHRSKNQLGKHYVKMHGAKG